jgi:8-oxo-dGTP diphosphatase
MLQFGEKSPGKIYSPRPGGYAVVFDEDRRLLAVSVRGEYFLPGGGIEAGESPAEAAIREAVEETGMTIRIFREIGRANEYVFSPTRHVYFNKIGTFYLAEIVDSNAGIDAERYPGALWTSINEFENKAFHKSHIWAVRQALTGSNQPPEAGRP